MNDKLISIALTTYNGEKYLEEFLNSICRQTYKNIELIVLDDCSNDKTVSILEKYKSLLNLKLYQNNFNIGYIKNFEKAISLCSGDFIALADQDDIWLPHKLEILINEIGENTLICSDAILINSTGTIIADSFIEYSNLYKSRNKLFETLIFKNFVLGCTILFKKEIVDFAIPIPKTENSHDNWLALVSYKLNGMKYCDEKLIYYRQHSSNTIGATNKSYFLIILNSYFNKKDRTAKKKMIDNLIMKFSNRLNMNIFNESEKHIIKDALRFYEGYKTKNYFYFYWLKILFKYKKHLF